MSKSIRKLQLAIAFACIAAGFTLRSYGDSLPVTEKKIPAKIDGATPGKITGEMAHLTIPDAKFIGHIELQDGKFAALYSVDHVGQWIKDHPEFTLAKVSDVKDDALPLLPKDTYVGDKLGKTVLCKEIIDQGHKFVPMSAEKAQGSGLVLLGAEMKTKDHAQLMPLKQP